MMTAHLFPTLCTGVYVPYCEWSITDSAFHMCAEKTHHSMLLQSLTEKSRISERATFIDPLLLLHQ
jgi:hypothetical protein